MRNRLRNQKSLERQSLLQTNTRQTADEKKFDICDESHLEDEIKTKKLYTTKVTTTDR